MYILSLAWISETGKKRCSDQRILGVTKYYGEVKSIIMDWINSHEGASVKETIQVKKIGGAILKNSNSVTPGDAPTIKSEEVFTIKSREKMPIEVPPYQECNQIVKINYERIKGETKQYGFTINCHFKPEKK